MPPRPPKHDPLVYIVRDRAGFLKIGFSTDLDRRLRELARLCRGHVDTLLTLPGGRDLEQHLHARFLADAVHGEYFRPSKELLAFIEEQKARQRSDAAATTGNDNATVRPALVWLAIEPRSDLAVCPCVRAASGRQYARARCDACNGAGVVAADALAERQVA